MLRPHYDWKCVPTIIISARRRREILGLAIVQVGLAAVIFVGGRVDRRRLSRRRNA